MNSSLDAESPLSATFTSDPDQTTKVQIVAIFLELSLWAMFSMAPIYPINKYS